jgi:hypothetical protein
LRIIATFGSSFAFYSSKTLLCIGFRFAKVAIALATDYAIAGLLILRLLS